MPPHFCYGCFAGKIHTPGSEKGAFFFPLQLYLFMHSPKYSHLHRCLVSIGMAVLIWASIFGIDARAEVGFQGQVVSASTGIPVEQAVVRLDKNPPDGTSEYEVHSVLFGFFNMETVEPGGYELTVQHPGFNEHRESILIHAEMELNRNKRIPLTQANVTPVFDVDFEVYDLATLTPLTGTDFLAEYWLPDGSITGVADQLFTSQADVMGKGGLRQLKDGFYKFTVKRAGWEDLVYQPTADIGVVTGDKVRLIRDHLAGIYMKPLRFPLKVEVKGYDPVKEEDGLGLRNVVLQLTGYDFQFDNQVLPTLSMLTDSDGGFTFTNLVAINHRLSIAKLGYKPLELDIVLDAGGNFSPVKTSIDLEPTKVKVVLDSPYDTSDAVSGAMIKLEGVLNSSAEGIKRSMEAVVEEDGLTVSALFEDLMPGRYWIQVAHEATLSGLPNRSGPLQGPDSFQVRFFPRETYAEVEPGVTEEVEIELEPVPAVVSGRLWATDESANLDFEPCFSEPNRLFYQKAQNGIEFTEHALIDLLETEHKVLSVDTDASGQYTALLVPGIYGIKIPGMSGYSGHNIECGDLGSGQAPVAGPWPYPDVWPFNNFEFGHHRAGLRFDSSHEYQLDLFTHKHFIHVSGFVDAHNEPFGNQVLSMNEDGSNLQSFAYNHLRETEALVVLTGPVSSVEPLRKNNRYLFKNLLPGSYSIQLEHPDYDSDVINFTIEGWDAPGILPRVEPFTPTYFFPGIAHCNSQFDLDVEWKHKGGVDFATSRYDAGEDRYIDSGSRRATYFTSLLTGTKLFQYAGNGSIPVGTYTAWLKHGDGWFFSSGSGTQTFERSIDGGPLDNTTPDRSPVYMGALPGQTRVNSLRNYNIDLRAVSAGDPNLEIDNVTVQFEGGTSLTAGGIVQFSGSPYPVGADQDPGQWTFSFFPASQVEVISPEERLLKVTVFMQRAMLITGTLKGTKGEAIPNAALVARNRYGNPLSNAVSQPNGSFSISRLTPQVLYLDINRRGYKSLRIRLAPEDLNQPDFLDQNLVMEKVPGPDITGFTMNRFGMFIPGVTKAGDSNFGSIGLNPEAAHGKLTATWKVQANPKTYPMNLPGFYGANEEPLPNESFQVTDPISEVWIVDRRSFRFPSVNEPNQTDAGEVEPPEPLTYPAIREWLSDITRAEKNNEPYYVTHKIALIGDKNEEGAFEGKLPLWELPSGEFTPMAVVITQNGGVKTMNYETPMVGDGRANPLRGMNLPKWAANILEVVGTAANLPTFSDAPQGEEEEPGSERRENTGALNRNYGDRFLKIANNAKVQARIGIVPIDSSPDNPDRTVFNPTEDLLATDLYLTYKYVLGVELPIGEDTPPNGPLSLASRFSGLKISGAGVDAEFEVAGSDNQACVALVLSQEIEANKEAAKTHTIPKLVERVKNLGGDRVSFDGPKVGISAKFATCETYTSTEEGLNQLSMRTGILEAQGTVDLGVGVDITPVIQFLPYGKPVQELNEGIKDLLGYEALKLEAIFELTTGAKVTVKFDFIVPEGRDNSKSLDPSLRFAETPAYNFIGAVTDELSQVNVSNEKKLILRVAVGLKGTIANGAMSATGLLQFGAPKGSSDTDGIFIDVNDFDKQPLIKKIAGAVSFVLRAKLNLYVTSLSKNWQYDFLTFSIERGSEPVFELTPLHTSSIIITPGSASPPRFVGQNGVVIDQFYDAGSMDFSAASGETAGLTFTGTDPATGEMTLMMSLNEEDQWQEPFEIARSPGIISLASTQLTEGSWVIVWSEIMDNDVMNPYPSTLVKSVTSNPGGSQWSAPTILFSSQDAVDQVHLESTGTGALAVFTVTNEGPMAANHTVFSSSYENGAWSVPSAILPHQSWTRFELVVRDATTASLATTIPSGDLILLHWDGVEWSEPQTTLSGISPSFSLAYNTDNDLVLAGIDLANTIQMFLWDAGTLSWRSMQTPSIVANSPEIEVLPLTLADHQVYLLTWLQGANQAGVWSAWLDAQGQILSEPRPSTFETEGDFYDLQMIATLDGRGHLVARHTVGEGTRIREISLGLPSEDDCDGDGIPDLIAIRNGLVQDCNGNGVPDSCDIRTGISNDVNRDGIPDACDPFGSGDCNLNGILDADEILLGMVEDLNLNGVPDECEGPVAEPTVRVVNILVSERARFYRGLDLIILGSDANSVILQVRGELETAPTLAGPWSLLP